MGRAAVHTANDDRRRRVFLHFPCLWWALHRRWATKFLPLDLPQCLMLLLLCFSVVVRLLF